MYEDDIQRFMLAVSDLLDEIDANELALENAADVRLFLEANGYITPKESA